MVDWHRFYRNFKLSYAKFVSILAHLSRAIRLYPLSLVAWLSLRIHDLSASHDRDQEHDCNALENDVDEGEEERDRANVVERFPSIGILHWLAGPDVAHHKDPKDVHHDGHDAQTNNLLTVNKQCETM